MKRRRTRGGKPPSRPRACHCYDHPSLITYHASSSGIIITLDHTSTASGGAVILLLHAERSRRRKSTGTDTGRRCRSASVSTHQAKSQACGSPRRQVPLNRHPSLQLHQLRYASHLDPYPVQLCITQSPHRPDVSLQPVHKRLCRDSSG